MPGATLAIKGVNTIQTLSTMLSNLAIIFYNALRGKAVPTGVDKYGGEIQEIKTALQAQAVKYKDALTAAISEAVSGQTAAAKIIYLLEKIKEGATPEVLGDLLPGIAKLVTQQLKESERLLELFTEISGGLVQVTHLRTSLIKKIEGDMSTNKEKHAAFVIERTKAIVWGIFTIPTIILPIVLFSRAGDARDNARVAKANTIVGKTAYEVVTNLCGDVEKAIELVREHIDHWADINRMIATQKKQSDSPAEWVRSNGSIATGLVDESIDEWKNVQKAYRDYSTDTRLSKQILQVTES